MIPNKDEKLYSASMDSLWWVERWNHMVKYFMKRWKKCRQEGEKSNENGGREGMRNGENKGQGRKWRAWRKKKIKKRREGRCKHGVG